MFKKLAKMKKAVSLALAFAMTLSMLAYFPTPAFADAGGVKSEDIAPVVAAKLAGDATLYDKVTEGYTTVDISCETEIDIELYKKLTVHPSGDVFYQFYLAGEAPEGMAEIFDQYHFVAEEDVVVPGNETAPVDETEPEESTEPEPTAEPSTEPEPTPDPSEIKDVNYEDPTGVKISVKMPGNATISVEEVAPLAGTEHWLIWEESLFYKITITDSEGNPFVPEDGINVVLPSGTVFSDGDKYNAYIVYNSSEAVSDSSGDFVQGLAVPFATTGIVGITKPTTVVEGAADVESVVSKSEYLTFYDTVYADLVYSAEATVTDADVLTVRGKDTISIGTKTVEVYYVDYSGDNEEINNALDDYCGYVLCSDVEEYVEPPVCEDRILTDSTTGIKVSGYLPTEAKLEIATVDISETGLDTTKYPLGEHSLVYDISLEYDNKPYQPTQDVYIEIPAEKIPFEFGSGFVLYHIHDDDTVEISGPIFYADGFINLPVSSFSYFVYTDAFVSAEYLDMTGCFKSNTVTFYEKPLSGAKTHTITNALDHTIYVENAYVDQNGEKWYQFYNDGIVDAYTEYLFVKSSVVSRIITDYNSGISVTGSLPDDVDVAVASVDNFENIIDTTKYALGADTVGYDISLSQNGTEYQPTSSVNVTFPASLFSSENGTYYTGYHVHDDTVEKLGNYQYTGEDVTVSVDSFSYVLLTTASEEELVKRQIPDEATGVVVEATVPNGATLTVTPWTTPQANETNGLIWNNALFYDIEITYNGETYIPEDAVVVFPTAELPFEIGEKYSSYYVDETGKVTLHSYAEEFTGMTDGEGTVIETVSEVWDGISIIGIGREIIYANGNVEYASDAEEGYEGFTGKFVNSNVKLYSEYALMDYVSFTTTETDSIYIGDKVTLTYGEGQTAEAYLIDSYAGENEDMLNAIAPEDSAQVAYYIVLCSEVEEYVDTPVFDDIVVKDEETGVMVSGTLPIGTVLNVTPITNITDIDLGNYPMGEHVVAYDISLSFKGSEFQPNGEVYVEIPESEIPFEFASGFLFYHIHENEDGEEEIDVTGPIFYADGFINVPVDSFSQFVFTDAFKSAEIVNRKGYFNKNTVELYEQPFAGAAVHTTTNALDRVVDIEFVYTDSSDTVWYEFYNTVTDSTEVEYLYVKADDMTTGPDTSDAELFEIVGADTGTSAANLFTTASPDMSANIPSVLSLSKNAAMPVDEGEEVENPTTGVEPPAGLVIDKRVDTVTADETYKITLEAYVTGEVEVETTGYPTDIVLVIDQSGSMDYAMGDAYFKASGTASSVYDDYNGELYVKVGDDYKQVSITRSGATTGYTYTQWYNGTNNQNNRGRNRWFYDQNRRGNLWYQDPADAEWYQVSVYRDGYNDDSYRYRYYYTKTVNGVSTTIYLGTEDEKDNDNYVGGRNAYPSFGTKLYGRTSNTTYSSYTYSYTGASGTVTKTYGKDDDISNEGYLIKGSQTRLQAMRTAVQTFVESVRTDAVGDVNKTSDNVDHRIAVVGFARDRYNNPYYSNTELFLPNGTTDVDEIPYNTITTANYQNAFQNVLVDDDMTGLRNIVGYDANKDGDYADTGETEGVLDGNGGTYINLGVRMANKIFANNPLQANENRRRIVIVFTDGSPGYDGDWNGEDYTFSETSYNGDNGDAEDVANATLAEAATTKKDISDGGYGATVYTVGIFPGADHDNYTLSADQKDITAFNYQAYSLYNGDAEGSTTKTAQQSANANRFMHYLSSNYKTASTMAGTNAVTDETFPRGSDEKVSGSRYMAASDAAGLNSIFQQLSQEVQGTADQKLSSTTVVKDIVSPYFALPAGVTAENAKNHIKAYTQKAKYTSGTLDWEAKEELASYTVNISEDAQGNDVVDVSGFDFAAHFVSEEGYEEGNPEAEGTYHGRKLVIEFEIDVDPYFLGGNNVQTNNPESGIIAPKEDGTGTYTVANFDIPDVDINIKPIDPQLQNQHIYITNNADLTKLFTGAHVVYTSEDRTEVEDVVTILDGTRNKYADVHFVVKDSTGKAIGMYTIPAGKVFGDSNCSWNTFTDLTPALTADKTYTVECVTNGDLTNVYDVTKTMENQASDNIDSLSGTATVYVYKPTLTFKDSTAYLGDTYPTIDNSNVAKTEWKHSTQGTANTDVMGTAPALTVIYDAPTGVVTQKGDVPVSVTSVVRTDNTSVAVPATYDHADCTGKTCVLPSDAELLIHVYSPALELKDSNVYYGGAVPGTDFTGNLVGTPVWSNTTLGNAPSNPAVKVTATNLPSEINTTADIPVTVKVTRADNDNDITANTVIDHSDCVTDENEGTADILLHVFVPSYTFKDAGVYLGTTVPTEKGVLDNTTTGGNWTSATGVSADNLAVANSPKLDVEYTPAKTGVITTAEDIGVNVEIKAGDLDATGVAKLTRGEHASSVKDSEFVLHVFKPVLPFADITAYYGDVIDITDSFDATEVTWTSDVPNLEKLTGAPDAPTAFDYDAEWANGVLVQETGDQYVVNSATDIPVNVVNVTVGNAQIAPAYVELTHINCTEGETMPDYAQGDKAEFVVHVNTVSLDVSKNVEGVTTSEKFDVTVTYTGKVSAPSPFENNVAQVTLGHGDTSAFTNLPVGNYVVTEVTQSSKYVTTTKVDEGNFATTNVARIRFDTTADDFVNYHKVTFNNKINVTSLTIHKDVDKDGASTYNVQDSFIFNVYKVVDGKETFYMRVALQDNKSVTIPELIVGDTYVVKEESDWSWRYGDVADVSATLEYDATPDNPDTQNEANFTNKATGPLYWLDNESHCENLFN